MVRHLHDFHPHVSSFLTWFIYELNWPKRWKNSKRTIESVPRLGKGNAPGTEGSLLVSWRSWEFWSTPDTGAFTSVCIVCYSVIPPFWDISYANWLWWTSSNLFFKIQSVRVVFSTHQSRYNTICGGMYLKWIIPGRIPPLWTSIWYSTSRERVPALMLISLYQSHVKLS